MSYFVFIHDWLITILDLSVSMGAISSDIRVVKSRRKLAIVLVLLKRYLIG